MAYRTHNCGELTLSDLGGTVSLAGWVDTIRDHGGVAFVDLRDQYGVTQTVFHDEALLARLHKESVVSVTGRVVKRDAETVNPKIPTGQLEVHVETLEVLGACENTLPFEVADSTATREDVRLQYRFLDLRNPKVHENILFRAQVVRFLREKMESLGFPEINTPILTCSSPEGARDYIIPSRKHEGKFYALPQAPQQFKQLLMVSGFDKYFQIAPCFRDEDARADRSPGEFYQLDFEMAFATQEDVFAVAEDVLYDTFEKFGGGKPVSPAPFLRIPYKEAMLRFGTDKPDLRNPLRIVDLTDFFADVDFKPFRGRPVRGIAAPAGKQSKSFFEKMLAFAESIGMKGLGYLTVLEDGSYKGPIAKFLSDEKQQSLKADLDLHTDDTLFFISDAPKVVDTLAGQIRTALGERLGLIDEDRFELCFITDFPMYERDEDGKLIFTHNPFSMPQGELAALETQDPLDILAYQYDIVCNGVELSSGAVRNHRPDVMLKAFELAGYPAEEVERRFGALFKAFHYGAPPHAGMAPGVDRMLMLLKGEENIREVIAFPMNANAQDLLLGAPNTVSEQQLREVHIKLRRPVQGE
ncbi:MAG TPA: aspartate--tRNA ligase [Candidatus Fimenecus excrementigallinarum]|uniref:Aspartate--tRNA(Asp/Asn) ligase n=1 Tax=Candidatus Fimenecus excrementigallinarum TaxID=2840816 RepID=A0A9D1IE63_9FIRM|nr:aspartate--tRNA ligase [Candidatus Fimenecus excrementigallinarum]